MNFDFEHLAVPFRMQPGLRRMAPDTPHLTPIDPASRLYQEKLSVYRAGEARHCVAGFDLAPALATIRAQALRAGIEGLKAGCAELELLVAQDLAILDAGTGTVPWMCVCVPSHWAPEDKLGKSLQAIHAPVADNTHLAAAWPHLLRLASNGTHWERTVWNVSPSPRYDCHPRRQPPSEWPTTDDPIEFASRCYLRVERQTLFPVHDALGHLLPQAVFTIQVMVEELTRMVLTAGQARRLHDSLQSMSAPVLAYKNLALARTPLLQWLSGLCR